MLEQISLFKDLTNNLEISGFENIDLLLKLTKEDISMQTELSYKVTILLQKLLDLSNIYIYLNEDEETELLCWNQNDFFSKIMYLLNIASSIIGEMYTLNLIHPVLDTNIELEDIIDSKEDLLDTLNNIRDICSYDIDIIDYIENYDEMTVEPYQIYFKSLVVPNLKDAMLNDDYDKAITTLIDYINLKLRFESNNVDNIKLILTDISQELHKRLDPEIVDNISCLIENDELDIDDLDDSEYFNLSVLSFENRYQKQKICQHYYQEKLKESNYYHKKCKKM